MKTFIAGHKGLLGHALLASLPPDIEPVIATRDELDLRDSFKVARFVEERKIESVILSAAKVGGIIANSSAKHEFLIENLQIQTSIISACLENRVKNLVFLGSSCVYSYELTPPFSEEDLGRGRFESTNEGYAIAKFAGIKLCQTISVEKKWNYLSLIPCNLYGPFDNFDIQTAHVIPTLIRKFWQAKQANDKTVEIMGHGMARREFLFSGDLARAIWYFHNKQVDGHILNIGSGSEVTIRDLASIISQIVGYRGEIHFLNQGLNGVESKLMDSLRANQMGWQPHVSIEEGIELAVAWFVSQQGSNFR